MDLLFVLLVCGAAAVVPALKIGLAGTRNAQRTGRNVLGDSRTGSRKRTVTQLDRRNEVGVAADEAVVTDLGAVLVIAVVVDNDRAAAEVDALADGRVTDIGQVRNLGAVADGGLLQLYEVADAAAVTDHALRADIGKRTDRGIATDGGFINLRIVYRGACADLGLFEDGVRAGCDSRAEWSRPEQYQRPAQCRCWSDRRSARPF